jgi:hypothetical protein
MLERRAREGWRAGARKADARALAAAQEVAMLDRLERGGDEPLTQDNVNEASPPSLSTPREEAAEGRRGGPARQPCPSPARSLGGA